VSSVSSLKHIQHRLGSDSFDRGVGIVWADGLVVPDDASAKVKSLEIEDSRCSVGADVAGRDGVAVCGFAEDDADR
jgi:hypothetical protein